MSRSRPCALAERVLVALAIAALLALGSGSAQSVDRIDLIRPDAPELAARGPLDVGVRTLEVVDPDRQDVLNAVEGEPTPTYDRPLVLEAWYPARLEPGQLPVGVYDVVTRNGVDRAELVGRAVRGAEPAASAGPYPLLIMSHGYPGNRYLLSHLGENLASKGYVVVSIDHTDSTYSDQAGFASTLLNRPLDQRFVLEEIARLAEPGSGSFLSGLVDADRTGVIGYSMGGYGVLNLIGAGFTEASAGFGFAPANRELMRRVAGSPQYPDGADPRIRAAIAIGPWGNNAGFWNVEGLAGVADVPTLIMAGSADDVSSYPAIVGIFEGLVNTDRWLLTFDGANHNAAAPIPAPSVTWDNGTWGHYGDSAWDTVRMNNIAQHFATAFLDAFIKGEEATLAYLDLIERAEEGVFALDDAGEPTDEHTYWLGFPERTAVNLSLRHLDAGE